MIKLYSHKIAFSKTLRHLLAAVVCLLCAATSWAQPLNEKQNNAKSASISFRLDKDQLEWDFSDNRLTQNEIIRLFSNNTIMRETDSIVVSAAASPEGNYLHNVRLSERRLQGVVKYLKENFPLLRHDKLRLESKGPDWDGLYQLALSDDNIPYKNELLDLIESDMSPDRKAVLLRQVGMGESYNYMKRHIFPQLRTSTALVLFYPKEIESIVNPPSIDLVDPDEPSRRLAPTGFGAVERKLDDITKPTHRYIRPFALKTNLLGDVVTLFNVELEIPIGKHFSILGEWTFPWWGGLGNRGGVSPVPVYSDQYTIQMLSASLEFRYWFPRSYSLNSKSKQWNDYNPLNGWFVGVYGGAGMYDFQMGGKGVQGEFKLNVGITAGYAHPIGKHFHMEYSIGLGYVATEYYSYTAKNGEKVVNVTPEGSYDRMSQNLFGPTKAKISLVWIPQFKVKNRK